MIRVRSIMLEVTALLVIGAILLLGLRLWPYRDPEQWERRNAANAEVLGGAIAGCSTAQEAIESLDSLSSEALRGLSYAKYRVLSDRPKVRQEDVTHVQIFANGAGSSRFGIGIFFHTRAGPEHRVFTSDGNSESDMPDTLFAERYAVWAPAED